MSLEDKKYKEEQQRILEAHSLSVQAQKDFKDFCRRRNISPLPNSLSRLDKAVEKLEEK